MRFYNILIVVFLLLMPVIGFSQVDETYLSSAIEKLNKNDVKGSIGDYTKFIVVCKTANDGINEAKGHYLRGLAHMQLQNYQEASDDFLQGFPFNHGDDFYTNITECFFNLNNLQGMIEMADKGLSKSNNPQTKGKLYKFSGLALYNSDAKEEACDFFKLAKDLGNIEATGYFSKYCEVEKNSKYYDEKVYNQLVKENSKTLTNFEKMDDGTFYKGGILNGMKEGAGSWKLSNGAIYEGEFSKDLFDGKGKLVLANGEWYLGEYEKGKKTGNGEYYFKNGSSYKGEWLNDQYNGQGVFKDINSGVFTGRFQKNEPQGVFQISFNDGSNYSGILKGWTKNGYGTATLANGDVYIGDFVNDVFQGQGKYVASSGWFYEGSFINGLFSEQGKMVMNDGKTWYEGSFSEGKYEGAGIFHFADGRYYKGAFKNGQKNGIGTLYDTNGKAIKTGNWIDDNFVKN